jgi:hypothetical protein
METTGTGEEVKTIVYLQTVKRTSPYLKYSDAASDVGGFYVFISFIFGGLVNCINKKMFLKQFVHDSYMVHYDTEYHKVPGIDEKPSDSKARTEKKSSFFKKKEKPVDEDADKTGFSDGGKNEGGSKDIYTNQQFLNDSDLQYDGGKGDDDVRSTGSRRSAKSNKSSTSKKSNLKKPKSKKKEDDAVSNKSGTKSHKSRNSLRSSGSKGSKGTPTPTPGDESVEGTYQPIELSIMQMLLLNITMPCCRSPYQNKLKTLL